MKGRNNTTGRTGKAPGTFAKGEGGGRKIYSTNSPGYVGTRIAGPRGNLPRWHDSLVRSWDRFEVRDARKRARYGYRTDASIGIYNERSGPLHPLTSEGQQAIAAVIRPRGVPQGVPHFNLQAAE